MEPSNNFQSAQKHSQLPVESIGLSEIKFPTDFLKNNLSYAQPNLPSFQPWHCTADKPNQIQQIQDLNLPTLTADIPELTDSYLSIESIPLKGLDLAHIQRSELFSKIKIPIRQINQTSFNNDKHGQFSEHQCKFYINDHPDYSQYSPIPFAASPELLLESKMYYKQKSSIQDEVNILANGILKNEKKISNDQNEVDSISSLENEDQACKNCQQLQSHILYLNYSQDLRSNVGNSNKTNKTKKSSKTYRYVKDSALNKSTESYDSFMYSNYGTLSPTEKLVEQVQEMLKNLEKISNLDPKTVDLDFNSEDRKLFRIFNRKFQQFNRSVMEKEQHDEPTTVFTTWTTLAQENMHKKILAIHLKYKKLFEQTSKNHKQHIDAQQLKFNETMNIIIKFKKQAISQAEIKQKSSPKSINQNQCKNQKSFRKNKLGSLESDESEEQKAINDQKTEKYEALLAKYSQRVTQLEAREKTLEKSKIELREQNQNAKKRNQAQFELFMRKIVQNKQSHTLESTSKQNFSKKTDLSPPTMTINDELFLAVSRRVFEISDCIPTDENDKDNLFAPENEQQLLERLDFIFRSYTDRKLCEENHKKALETLKRQFIRSFVEAIKTNMIPPAEMIQILSKNQHLTHLSKLVLQPTSHS